jgi:hypothetical protein
MFTPKEMNRFISYIFIPKNENECWIWTGAKTRYGYGQFYFRSKVHPVHRLMYTFIYGEIRYGKVIHHTCHNRLCVNSDHLIEMDYDEHKFLHETERKNGNMPRPKSPNNVMLQSNVDARKYLSILQWMEENYGIKPKTHSEAVRSILDLLAESSTKQFPLLKDQNAAVQIINDRFMQTNVRTSYGFKPEPTKTDTIAPAITPEYTQMQSSPSSIPTSDHEMHTVQWYAEITANMNAIKRNIFLRECVQSHTEDIEDTLHLLLIDNLDGELLLTEYALKEPKIQCRCDICVDADISLSHSDRQYWHKRNSDARKGTF